jgi:hypothetical protein
MAYSIAKSDFSMLFLLFIGIRSILAIGAVI